MAEKTIQPGGRMESKGEVHSIATVAEALAERYGAQWIRVDSPHGLVIQAGLRISHRVIVGGDGTIKVRLQRTKKYTTMASMSALFKAVGEIDISTEAEKAKPMRSGVTVASLYQLLAQQLYRCALTGRELTTDNVELDHIVARSTNGEHHIGNVQLVVSEVNRAKNTMEMDEFVRLCRDVVATVGDSVPNASNRE